ncbi:hypothetical protein AB3548_08510 [Acinetobacter baumannii]
MTKIERSSGVNNCPNSNAVTNYDNNGYVSSEIDWNGVETTYRRDANGLLLEKVHLRVNHLPNTLGLTHHI